MQRVMSRTWLETRVEIAAEAAEAVADRLVELGSPGLVTEEEGDRVRLVAYFDRDDQVEASRRFAAALDPIAAVSATRIDSENWAENWKRHFPPLPIGERLWVCPPWAPAPPPGRLAVVIDPGMAFGTGNHATTSACLELLERHLPPGADVLDVGTGSGVLSIAALRLGARRAVGVDTDPLATTAARENAARNSVAGGFEVRSSLEEVAGEFDLAVANIQLNVLLELEAAIAARLGPGGLLIASGLLRGDLDDWKRGYARNWRPGETAGDDEWVAVVATRG